MRAPITPPRPTAYLETVRLSAALVRSTRRLLVAVLVLAGAPAVPAQTKAPTDTLAEARRLRDVGDYAGAGALLRPYVEAHLDDPGSARFAALMSYWAKDVRAADSIYAAALIRHPDDLELRLEYGQMLIESGNGPRARVVLSPFAPASSAPATTVAAPTLARGRALLGTLAYWTGDFVEARRRFKDALRLDSSHVEARRQLREIEAAAASWVRVGAEGWDDDQPLQRVTLTADGGMFANPLTPLTLRARTIRFDADGVTETVSLAEGVVATFAPAARLELGIAAGMLQRTFGDATDWTGRAALGLRLPSNTLLQLSVERAPYLHTTASLSTPIMTWTTEGLLRWRGGGWMGDAVARRERYPDDNDVTTGYAWLLAPLVRRQSASLHAGYSVSAQSASESRFLPRADALNFPPGQAPMTVPGAYAPYYTPRNLRVHSALASARAVPNGRWTLTADAAVALHARDDAPTLLVVPSPPDVDVVRAYYDRRFTPWNVRGGIEVGVSEATRIALTIEHGQRAYYAFTGVAASLTHTFVAAARRRAERP